MLIGQRMTPELRLKFVFSRKCDMMMYKKIVSIHEFSMYVLTQEQEYSPIKGCEKGNESVIRTNGNCLHPPE